MGKHKNKYMIDPQKVKECIKEIRAIEDLDPKTKTLCVKIMKRAVPVKPTGWDPDRPYETVACRCGVCNARVRNGITRGSAVREKVCRQCFTIIDWGEPKE